jgi:signal peptidase II
VARNRWLTAAAVATAVVAADQLTKTVVIHRASGSPYWLADRFGIELAHNTGISFGRLQGGGRPVIAVVTVVTVILTILIWRLPLRFTAPLALIVGGSLGNLIDRLRWGYVVDYVALGPWPNFNVADAAIVSGAALVAWQALRTTPRQGGDA